MTDEDGDQISLSEVGEESPAFSITVWDDVPDQTENTENGVVEEEALAGGNQELDDDDNPATADADDVPDTAVATGSLSSLVSVGTDQPGGFSIDENFAGDSGLTTNGEADTVYYVVDDANNLRGNTAADGSGANIFTLNVTDAGAYTFTLLDQIDHHPVGSADDVEATLDINFTDAILVADEDGDQISLSDVEESPAFSITVWDDVPEQTGTTESGVVEEEALQPEGNQELGDAQPDTAVATGSLASLASVGADQDGEFSLDTSFAGNSGLTTSGGVDAIYYVVDDANNLRGNTAADGSGTDIFNLNVTSAGAYTFTLLDQIDHHPVASADDVEGSLNIDFTDAIMVADEDGDQISLSDVEESPAFSITVWDDVPEVGVPQDAVLANEPGNSVTGSLDILGIGADEPISISLGLESGQQVLGINGEPTYSFTTDGAPLFWQQNPDGSWSAVSEGGVKAFTVSIDQESGTYTVYQDNGLDGGTTVETIGFGDGVGGGNPSVAAFNLPDGKSTATGTYTGDLYIYAQGSGNLENDFGAGIDDPLVQDVFGDNAATVNFSDQGIGVGKDSNNTGYGGQFIGAAKDTETDGGRISEILSLKFYTTIQIDTATDDLIVDGGSTAAEISNATIVLDHIGTDDTAYYTLWSSGAQVSGELTFTPDPNVYNTSGGDAATDIPLVITQADITTGTTFDEVRFEVSTGDSYRVVSTQIEEVTEGVDETLLIPFEVVDADGDVIDTMTVQTTEGSEEEVPLSFSITFDGQGIIDAAAADAADGDVSTTGMVISGSSGDDIITGTVYDDTIYGRDGSDNMSGGDGDDFLVGDIVDDFGDGVGADVSNDIIDGGAGDDVLIGGLGADSLSGGDGDDVLVGDLVDFDGTDPVLSTSPDIIDDGVEDVIVGGENDEGGIDGSTFTGDASVDANDPGADDIPEDISEVEHEIVEGNDIDPGGEDVDPLIYLIPPPEDAA